MTTHGIARIFEGLKSEVYRGVVHYIFVLCRVGGNLSIVKVEIFESHMQFVEKRKPLSLYALSCEIAVGDNLGDENL